MLLPDKMPLVAETKTTGAFGYVRNITPDGVIYKAIYGTSTFNKIEKSTDYGETWTAVGSVGVSSITAIFKVSTGHLVVVQADGFVYRSDENEQNFTQVHKTHGAHQGVSNSHQYGDWLFLSDYGTLGTKAYSSTDGGATWRTIFTSPEPSVGHCHDVKYDPYEGLIWIATGDRINVARIYFSDDWGKTWQTHSYDTRYRVTAIMPLPDCVLFGSDEANELLVYKHTRPERGTSGTDLVLERFWSPKKYLNEPDAFTWVSVPAITYGANARAYFGVLYMKGNENMPAHMPATVWATDGNKFFPVWMDKELTQYNLGYGGITGVFGPDDNGKIVADLRSSYGVVGSGADYKTLIISNN